MDALSIIAPRIHREGRKFIILFAVIALVLFVLWEPLGWIGIVLTVWCFYFFRDPDRFTPIGSDFVIAPADGVVCNVALTAPPSELELGDEQYLRIGVFMNVFNCHVNRMPLAGVVELCVYHPGKFLNASLDKASEENERQSLKIVTDKAGPIGVVQIAGLVARRIVCDVKENDMVKAGERFGMIRFGSRVDVYLKADTVPLVSVGQTVTAGETILADLSLSGEGRVSEIR